MGKTFKAKAKAKAKAAKAARKVARKCKGAAVAAALGFASLVLCGCATSDSAQPAKANTMSNTFDDCIIVVATHATISNRVVTVEGTKDVPAIELFTQTQSLESSGTESYAQTATQTPTNDVKPDVNVRYNDAVAGATAASKDVLDALTVASRAKVLEMMESKGTGTVEVERADGSKAAVECRDGQCSFSGGK